MMHKRKVMIGWIAVLLITLTLGFPIISEAVVFWTEDFENHLWTGGNANPWDTGACLYSGYQSPPPDGCNPTITTDLPRAGTHSLKSTFDASCGNSATSQGCGQYYDRYLPPGTRNVYMRFYYYTVGFTYDATATKHLYNVSAGPNGLELVWENLYGSREFGANAITAQPVLCPTTGIMDTSCNLFPNIRHIPLQDGQWYCVETHVYAGTANQANGLIEVWVNGTQTLSYANYPLAFNNTSGYDIVRPFGQWGLGVRYIDDLVVGDARIGCSGSTTQAPAAPTGLTVQ